MTDNGLHFPVTTEGDNYGINKAEREITSPNNGGLYHNPPDGSQIYLTPEEQAAGVRLKRRRRCGQCGPCQVKENCNKCHYCVRKDVLKQTCVYRKCIYLRSKPKPYMRSSRDAIPFSSRLVSSPPLDPPQNQDFNPPQAQSHTPAAEVTDTCSSVTSDATSVVKTPPVSTANSASQSQIDDAETIPKCSSETNGATVTQTTSPTTPPQSFPFSIPQPQRPFQMDNVLGQNSHYPGGSSGLGGSTIQPVPLPPSFDHPVAPFTNNHSLVPGLSNSIEKSFTDYSNQRFPHSHLHMPIPHQIRDSQSMMNLHYPGYNKSLTEARPNARSPCMYGPTLPPFPSAMSAISAMPFDRGPMQSSSLDSLERPSNGTTYLPNSSDIFRQYPSLPSATPGYPYSSPHSRFSSSHSFPHSGYPTSSTYSGYSGFGMPHPPNLPIPPPIPGNSSHFGSYSASSALSSFNQSHGCPKNVQHPPASLTSVTHLMQENCGCINKSRDNVPSSDDSSQSLTKDCISQNPSIVTMETSEMEKLEVQQEGVSSNKTINNDSKKTGPREESVDAEYTENCTSQNLYASPLVEKRYLSNNSQLESHKPTVAMNLDKLQQYYNKSDVSPNDSAIIPNTQNPNAKTYNTTSSSDSVSSVFNILSGNLAKNGERLFMCDPYYQCELSGIDKLEFNLALCSDDCDYQYIDTELSEGYSDSNSNSCHIADQLTHAAATEESSLITSEKKPVASSSKHVREQLMKSFVCRTVNTQQDIGDGGRVQVGIPRHMVTVEEWRSNNEE